MAFKPIVKELLVVDEGETEKLFVRQPSGREMLDLAAKFRKEDFAPVDVAQHLFSKFVVREDGAALNKDEVNEMMSWRFAAMNKASLMVQEAIGLTQVGGDAAAKKS